MFSSYKWNLKDQRNDPSRFFFKGTVIVLNIKYTSRGTTWQLNVNPLAPFEELIYVPEPTRHLRGQVKRLLDRIPQIFVYKPDTTALFGRNPHSAASRLLHILRC
jgi:hypothetical protein